MEEQQVAKLAFIKEVQYRKREDEDPEELTIGSLEKEANVEQVEVGESYWFLSYFCSSCRCVIPQHMLRYNCLECRKASIDHDVCDSCFHDNTKLKKHPQEELIEVEGDDGGARVVNKGDKTTEPEARWKKIVSKEYIERHSKERDKEELRRIHWRVSSIICDLQVYSCIFFPIGDEPPTKIQSDVRLSIQFEISNTPLRWRDSSYKIVFRSPSATHFPPSGSSTSGIHPALILHPHSLHAQLEDNLIVADTEGEKMGFVFPSREAMDTFVDYWKDLFSCPPSQI